MSELTRCNFCDWKRLEKKGYRIATKDDLEKMKEKGFEGGVVMVNQQGEFACWFMSLPKHCCC